MSKEKSLFKRFYNRYQVWINLMVLPVVAIIIFWLLIQFMDIWTHHGKTAIMPNIVKKDFYDAKNILESLGFDVEVDSIFDPRIRHGQVIDQSPKPKEVVKYGRTVYLKINSFFPEMKKVDDKLLHISSVQAQKTLQSMGFTRIVIKYVEGGNNDEVVKIKYNGRVYKNGEKVPVTAEVELTVTKSKKAAYTVDEERRQVQVSDSSILEPLKQDEEIKQIEASKAPVSTDPVQEDPQKIQIEPPRETYK